jgi:hypothetical protein
MLNRYQISHNFKQSACHRSKLLEVKGKAVHMYAKKPYLEVIAPLILNLGNKGV